LFSCPLLVLGSAYQVTDNVYPLCREFNYMYLVTGVHSVLINVLDFRF
jgi:hypothetical protein